MIKKLFSKNIYYPLLFIIFLVIEFILSACVAGDCPSGVVDGCKTNVHLKFNFTDGNKSRAIIPTSEDTITDITALIFDSKGILISHNYSTSVDSMNINIKINASSSNNCTIYAIANTGSATYFSEVDNLEKLNEMYTTISNASALENTGSTSGSNGIMMVGKITGADIKTDNENNFAVDLYHQCSKFTFTIKPAESVTITGYQLCNVPLSSYITDSHVPSSSSVAVSPPGGANNYGNFNAVSGLNYTSEFSNTYYIYENLCGCSSDSLRNSKNLPSSKLASPSYLLVQAQNGNWNSTYSIYLGGITNSFNTETDLTNFNVYRNINYQCDINIGSNGGEGDARVNYVANLHQFLFNDGTVGKIPDNPNKVPIAIVFSTNISAIDKEKGYHGYAISLKDVPGSFEWGPRDGSDNNPTGCMNSYLDVTDYDGYTHTMKINNTTHPAAYAAATTYNSLVVPPKGTSGWYVPSVGQLFQLCTNLGGIPSTGFYDDRATGTIAWSQKAQAALTSLNGAMNEAGSDKYDSFISDAYYWSSSDNFIQDAYGLKFYYGIDVVLQGLQKEISYYVRPAITF